MNLISTLYNNQEKYRAYPVPFAIAYNKPLRSEGNQLDVIVRSKQTEEKTKYKQLSIMGEVAY